MPFIEQLSSSSNPKIKKLLALQQKSSQRRESGLFVVEGIRELLHCIEAGYKVESLFVCPEIAKPSLVESIAKQTKARIFELDKALYAKLAYREGTEGVIAEVHYKSLSLQDLRLKPNPLIAVIEGVEKPGNVGAILRSCDAVGADALIICDPKCDIYNPNLIRASIGAVFTVPCAVCSTTEAISYLQGADIQILTAQLQDSSLYYDCSMTRGTAIVMGTEDCGLSDQFRLAADAHIRIPMLGQLDSLNVSVSCAILLFEALRQRQ